MAQLSQVGTTTFTGEQFELMLKMIPNSTISSPSIDSANAGISAFIDSFKSQEWIIDTKMTNHMVLELNLLVEKSVTQPEKSKKVYLPDGDTTIVTHVGNCRLTKGDVLT